MEKMYKIGKITLTQQALGVFIIGTIVTLTALAILRSAKGVGVAAGFFAFTCYTTYLTNCVVVGNCKELAWVLVALNAITALTAITSIKKLRD